MTINWISIISALLAAIFAFISQRILASVKKKSDQDLEKVKNEINRENIDEKLKLKYTLPLLRASEDLYNKLNSLVNNRSRELPLFNDFGKKYEGIRSMNDILKSNSTIFILGVIYSLSRFFAANEIIRKELGFLKFISNSETRTIQRCLRQVNAVFSSGRLLSGIKIKSPKNLKDRGIILDGVRILISESIIYENDNEHTIISFYDFCRKISSDKDFRQCLLPLVYFFNELVELTIISSEEEVDFRWPRLIIFSKFLKKFVDEIDTSNMTVLLPELKNFTDDFIKNNAVLETNIENFRKAYPDNSNYAH